MLEHLFTTSVWRSKIFNDKLDNLIINYLENEKQNNKEGRKHSNAGGYHTEFIPLDNPIFQLLGESLTPHIEESWKLKNFFFYNGWIIENSKGHFNMPHIHSLSAFSGVYYLKTNKDSGNLYFENPNQIIEMMEYKNLSIDKEHTDLKPSHGIIPKDKDLILFPSFLRHGVEPNLSESNRIIMSFNIGVRC
jgi:uncharacterized protein (TIGR02466 family)|tara:strand:- start:2903 stop:3475 length:573 start_codon:yes stop_codon:yes gene_type:complete